MFAFVVLENQEGQALGFEASGHVGTLPRGENLACAAASLLMQTLITGIKDEVRVPLELAREADGLSCRFARTPGQEEQERIDFLIRVIERGLADLQEIDQNAVIRVERKRA
jgi:uncharacterized protein YsxB (DUF464 family)